ncbi:MAG: leucyl aminopeptidase, partial [Microcoleus sp. SIO2G3]|nr:leucyl aminopeptidase [Microcoleus sp. SIO2G3]
MDFRGIETSRLDWTGDCLAIGLFEEAIELTGDLAALDQKLSGTLSELIAESEFKGKEGSSAITRVGANSPIRKVAIVGLGKSDALSLNSLRRAAASVARLAKREKVKTLGLDLPIQKDVALSTQAIVEGVELALYQDNRFKR